MQASLSANSKTSTRNGTVSSYDPDSYTAIVDLFPAGVDNQPLQTGWIPIKSMWVGNGWGMFTPPIIGQLVEVTFLEGNLNNGYVSGYFFNDVELNSSVESGEAWFVHESGSFIKLTNDGKVSINGNVEIDLTSPSINITVTNSCNIQAENVSIVANVEASVTAPVINLGVDGGDLQALMNGAAIAVYNGHTHNVPTVGDSDAPNQQMGSAELTENLKAS